MKLRQHTSQQYEAELQALKDRILTMGGRCEDLLRRALKALEKNDVSLAQEVERTDREINRDELAVDDLAVRILALRQPVGRDLRFLLTALKVVVDLERIGDEAVNVAERVTELAQDVGRPGIEIGELNRMAQLSIEMLHQALDAYVEEDADKARSVLLRDDEVDASYGQMLQVSMAFMGKHPDRIAAGMAVASCAKYIERIADHSTNIAEMVVYMVRGIDVRHRGNR